MNCNNSNENISENEWYQIELQCKTQNHLSPTDKLKTLIITDEELLFQNDITFENLDNFFEDLQYKYYLECVKENGFMLTSFNSNKSNCFTIALDKLKIKCTDMISRVEFIEIYKNIYTYRCDYMGAEICPFKSSEDKCYRGHEYGCSDWFFINIETMDVLHIGDLLFHQIVKHHFFQSLDSVYRVNPNELINFFGKDVIKHAQKPITNDVYKHRYIESSKMSRLRMLQLMSGMAGLKYDI